MLIWPVFIGHRPRRCIAHGSSFCLRAVKPYAITCNSAVTLPWIDETPTTSNASVLLSGVKTTLNSVAVKLELSWQGFRDLDSINLVADTIGRMLGMKVRMSGNAGNINGRRMLTVPS